MSEAKVPKTQQDRLLKRLPLHERKRQLEIRRLILSGEAWKNAQQ